MTIVKLNDDDFCQLRFEPSSIHLDDANKRFTVLAEEAEVHTPPFKQLKNGMIVIHSWSDLDIHAFEPGGCFHKGKLAGLPVEWQNDDYWIDGISITKSKLILRLWRAIPNPDVILTFARCQWEAEFEDTELFARD